jgi:hypothetical protein
MMRNASAVAALAAVLAGSGLLAASESHAQSRPAQPQSFTLIGVDGRPYDPARGSVPVLPGGSSVSTLPSGRTIITPGQVVVVVPGQGPQTNSSTAPAQLYRIDGGDARAVNRASGVQVTNGSSQSLRPETGPKIIEIQRR